MKAFEVDKEGLARLLERRGKSWAVLELIQNALDEKSSRIGVEIHPTANSRGYHTISVEDDNPDGFVDLTHAYTLFAESAKKGDPEKRGRFNLGEKLVIACCRRASISTTTGTIYFDGDRRRRGKALRHFGSVFEGEIRMTAAEAEEAVATARGVIVPPGVALAINGVDVPYRGAARTCQVKLPTERADADGYLRRTERETSVSWYATPPGVPGRLFELGIPVVEIEGPWDVDVRQKVPLNADRDNVTPAYLKRIRVATLNECGYMLPVESAREPWVDDALESPEISDQAVDVVINARYGLKRVIADPSDPESTKIALSKGFTVINGGSYNRAQWDNIRRAGAALPSGQVTPSPRPYVEGAPPVRMLPPEDHTDGMRDVAALASRLSLALLGHDVTTTFAYDKGWPVLATWGRGPAPLAHARLTFNVGALGVEFFEPIKSLRASRVVAILLHEMAHDYSSDHLSSEYHEAICDLGARLAIIVQKEPKILSD